jgi:chromosome partitioning protein
MKRQMGPDSATISKKLFEEPSGPLAEAAFFSAWQRGRPPRIIAPRKPTDASYGGPVSGDQGGAGRRDRMTDQNFTPAEVADIAGIPKTQLLEWEKEGKIAPAPRDEHNHRTFTPEQVSDIVQLAGPVIRRRISIVNQKGGVGKTTTTFNLGACLARRGQKVLVVDLDAQANLTISFGHNPDDIQKTSYDLFTEESTTLEQVTVKTEYGNLWLVPADIRLAGADAKLRDMLVRERILDTKLEPVRDVYNFILFDCPPNLSTVTINALVASSDAIVPIETQFYSMKAIDDLTSTFDLIKRKMNHAIKTWILPTKIDRRVKVHNGMLDMLEQNFGGRMLTPIKTDAKLASAPMIKQPVIYSYPASRSAHDFERLTMEVLAQ